MKVVGSVALIVVATSCSNGEKNTPGPGKPSGPGSGSAASVTPPKEEMVSIAAGHYLTSELAFAPPGDGTCPASILARVAALSKAPWPDARNEIRAFTIDKRAVSCADYRKCVQAKKCRDLRDDDYRGCVHKFAQVPIDQAVAYCRWRDAKLPTLTQWQAAVRGVDGKEFGECDPSIDPETCFHTAASGLVVEIATPYDEFTSTIGCWPESEVRPTAGKYPVMAFLHARQLNAFVPFDPAKPFRTGRFRCVRDQAVVVPETNP